jgi:hypothetical protein
MAQLTPTEVMILGAQSLERLVTNAVTAGAVYLPNPTLALEDLMNVTQLLEVHPSFLKNNGTRMLGIILEFSDLIPKVGESATLINEQLATLRSALETAEAEEIREMRDNNETIDTSGLDSIQ